MAVTSSKLEQLRESVESQVRVIGIMWHRVILDMASWGSFKREFQALYKAVVIDSLFTPQAQLRLGSVATRNSVGRKEVGQLVENV